MSGYVSIHRSLLGHVAFRNDAEAMAFAWMIARAQWRAEKVRYKDRVISLQRGQLAVSVRDMAAAMDRDKAWVERLWKRLKSETMIETLTEAGVSVITIVNYDVFQGERDTDETGRETPCETGARQGRDTEQEENNLNTKNTGARVKGTRLTDDWQPQPFRSGKAAELVALRGPEWVSTELEKFRNHWIAKPGKDAISLDWQRTWQNWVIRANELGRPPPGAFRQQSSPSPQSDLHVLMRQAERYRTSTAA